MPTVARVRWPEMNIDFGYVFKLTSFPELMDYWEKVRMNRLRDGFSNFMKSAEFRQMTDSGRMGQHLSHPDAYFLHARASAEMQKDSPGSIVQVLASCADDLLKGMLRVLHDKGSVYVNKNGGYFLLSSGMEEKEVRTVDAFVLPGQKIEVKAWPGGKHWYAYVGGTSVERNGEKKWSSKAMAQLNAEKWAKEHNISFEEAD